ncbi:MAG: hypothetical protein K9L98_00030 [Candidatus Pacebacteria bacterium]|nr:hypothetical protein [Candidatus Paceibacterota bacterium]MCF7862391.1 hypothetical protein [Candidatus Paceibacterota bacterium]
MKKNIFLLFSIFAITFMFTFVLTKTVSAKDGSYVGFFGGKILDTKSLQIKQLEYDGFDCSYVGTTFTIQPVGNYPTEYYVPREVKTATQTIVRASQWSLGAYTTNTIIDCEKEIDAEKGADAEDIEMMHVAVSLPTIVLYGTSKH